MKTKCYFVIFVTEGESVYWFTLDLMAHLLCLVRFYRELIDDFFTFSPDTIYIVLV